MKKFISFCLALVLLLALAACGGDAGQAQGGGNGDAAEGNAPAESSAPAGTDAEPETEAGQLVPEDGRGDEGNVPAATSTDLVSTSDLAYVLDKGVLVVGITEFAPMDYTDADGNWIGFDADMATAFAESLGVDVEFQVIEWGNKVFELDGKTIDCVWNGMTLNEEVLASMACSVPYCNNAQVVVVPADKAEDYQTVDSVKGLSFAVESGSVGQEQVEAMDAAYTEVLDQATALLEVSAGSSDAAVIDALMAAAMVGEGTSYENLAYTVGLNSEEYGVGFRKDSDLAELLNRFFRSAYADGRLDACAEKYGIQAALIPQE